MRLSVLHIAANHVRICVNHGYANQTRLIEVNGEVGQMQCVGAGIMGLKQAVKKGHHIAALLAVKCI